MIVYFPHDTPRKVKTNPQHLVLHPFLHLLVKSERGCGNNKQQQQQHQGLHSHFHIYTATSNKWKQKHCFCLV